MEETEYKDVLIPDLQGTGRYVIVLEENRYFIALINDSIKREITKTEVDDLISCYNKYGSSINLARTLMDIFFKDHDKGQVERIKNRRRVRMMEIRKKKKQRLKRLKKLASNKGRKKKHKKHKKS